MNREPKEIGWRRDWPVIPYIFGVIIGFVVSVYDFWKIQHLNFQLSTFIIIGIILLVIGGSLRIISRVTLTKAGFNIVNSYKLQIVKNHQLITGGIYSHIRHPLYLGEMSRNIGFALILSSFYGTILMIIADIFLLFRIEIEEKMLIDEFGHEYEKYKSKTKKFLPYVY